MSINHIHWIERAFVIESIVYSLCLKDPSIGGWKARIIAAKLWEARQCSR